MMQLASNIWKLLLVLIIWPPFSNMDDYAGSW